MFPFLDLMQPFEKYELICGLVTDRKRLLWTSASLLVRAKLNLSIKL